MHVEQWRACVSLFNPLHSYLNCLRFTFDFACDEIESDYVSAITEISCPIDSGATLPLARQ